MASLCKGGNESPGYLKANQLVNYNINCVTSGGGCEDNSGKCDRCGGCGNISCSGNGKQ